MAESPVTTSMAPSHQLVTTYTASYDAAGNMTCRAPDTTTTCAGTPTGAQLSYDTQGRRASWSGRTTADSFLYDSDANRVTQQAPLNGSFTTIYVDGGQEEIATARNGSPHSALHARSWWAWLFTRDNWGSV